MGFMDMMRKSVLLLIVRAAYLSACIHAESGHGFFEGNIGENDIRKESTDKVSVRKNFSFKFTDENLVDVINIVAEFKGVNVLLPTMADAISSKVTVAIEEKMDTDEAWNFLIQILDIAGYSIVPKPGGYGVIKTTPQVARASLPLYIGVPWETIPNTEQRIRCVFYLSNIKVPADGQDQSNELNAVISKLLPNGESGVQDPSNARLAYDPVTNAIIIAERASVIRSVMQIISALDTTGFKEKIELLPLFNTLASDVKQIFDDIMKTPQRNPYGLDARKPTVEATYFSKFVRIIPYSRLNTLIILGREQAVDRVKEFIKKYIDVTQDSGQSVFHTYSLQYLDAKEFAPILQNIVDATSTTGGTGQSRAEGAAQSQGGTERMFEGVRITHDRPEDAGSGASGGDSKTDVSYYGGNRLIIAARHDDWLRIKKLCEELDKPQPQVIIEVLVADLTLDDSRLIGSMLRNPINVPLVGDMQFQSAQLARGILVNNLDKNQGLSPATVGLDNQDHNNDTDILKDAYDSSGNPLTSETKSVDNTSIVSQADLGTTAVSLIDPSTKKVWSLLEVRNYLGWRRVLTNPHIIAVNNQPTKLVIGETRLVPDAAQGQQGGNSMVPRKKIPGQLVLNFTPRICLSPDENIDNDTVQLGIDVAIDEFTSSAFVSTAANPQGANVFKRHVTTSAHVRSREVIPLGGLLRRDAAQNVSETPLLGNIPIIGYFFKNRGGTSTDTNLTVFICPTVIRPRLRLGGVDTYTRDYVKLTKRYAQEGVLFDSLRDPVTRWFFNTESDVIDTVNDFLADDVLTRDKEIHILTKRSKARQQARKERLAKEQEYVEMQEGADTTDEVARDRQTYRQTSGLLSEQQQVRTAQVALSQERSSSDVLDDKAAILKQLVEHEDNPLKRTATT
jgi:general secretion pathway protein D